MSKRSQRAGLSSGMASGLVGCGTEVVGEVVQRGLVVRCGAACSASRRMPLQGFLHADCGCDRQG